MPENQSYTETKKTFSKNLGAYSLATLLSRILGYIRDALVASYFGGGRYTDAFYAAFKIPNLLRRFFGEGSMTAAFIPVFSDVLHKKGQDEARRFLHALMTTLFVLLVLIVGLGILFAPQVAQLVAWGFNDEPEKMALTIDLVRLTFPFLLIISFAALVSAILNSCGRFFIPGVSPSGLSIGEIAFIIFIASKMDSPIHGLAISAVIGVGIHFLWQLPALYKEGYSIKFGNPFLNPEVKKVFFLMIPTMIGLSSDQVNSFIDQVCASFLAEGSITALYNSNRVMQLPLALFGIAVASVSLPSLSKLTSANKMGEFKHTVNFSLRIANYVLIPSFIGLAVVGLPIIQVLFQHGRFTMAQSALTYSTLVPYAFGLPAYSSTKILASAFYARQDTKTPVKISLGCMILNSMLNVILMQKWGAAGLAMATAIAAWVQSLLLFYVLRKDVGLLGGREIIKSFLSGCGVGVAMGIICHIIGYWILGGASVYMRVLASITGGAAAYFLLSKFFNVPEFSFFIEAFKRKTAY